MNYKTEMIHEREMLSISSKLNCRHVGLLLLFMNLLPVMFGHQGCDGMQSCSEWCCAVCVKALPVKLIRNMGDGSGSTETLDPR